MSLLTVLEVVFVTLCYASYDYYRLPQSVKPQHYNLRILTHLEDASRLFFTGDVEIQLRIIHATSNITLHVGARLNVARNATWLQLVGGKCNKDIKIKSVERNSKYDFYIMHLDSQLWPSQGYILRMQFWSRLGKTMSGYYVSSYPDEHDSGQIKFMTVTQFEPTDARAAFPCFDEPNFKTTFKISLGHSAQYNALSNMPLIERIPISDRSNWVWSIFKQTEIMSTYLVAYSINDFEGYVSYSARSEHAIKFTTWARPSVIEQCKYAAEIGPRIMDYYEKLFDIGYPLPKMDQLAVPDFSAGAMENWGLITYREVSLLYAEETSSLTDKQHVTNIIAHELAHQWFGNLVTMEWWNDLWLNEGFATYVATLGMDNMCNNWNAYEEESLDNVLSILNTDSFCSTRPIHQPVSRGSQIADLFDSITYRKGAVIIRMMHMFIGHEAFQNGINCYLQKHSYINAKQEDLWLALTKASHQINSIPQDLDVGTVMNTWTLQPGIPLITVERNYLKKSATVTQMRYLIYDEPIQLKSHHYPFEPDFCWFIPISYTTDSQSNFISTEPLTWLRCNEDQDNLALELQDLPGAEEWLILNLQLATPYRVKYDVTNWKLIIKSLQSSFFMRVHVMNRAQLIDDSLALAWSGHLNYELAFQLLVYLKHEREYMPWKAALDQLTAIERIMRQTSEFEKFQHFMHHLLCPIYNHLEGMLEDLDERHHVAHKVLINKWACRLSQADCVKRALKYYHRWFISKKPYKLSPVPQNLRSVIYCTAIRHGDADDWNFLWKRYRNCTVASEKRLILLSLTCSRDVNQIERYLRLIFKEKSPIRKQDASQIFAAIVHNDVCFHIAKDFLMNNFKRLQKFYEPNKRELASLIIQIAQNINCPRDYRELKEFMDVQKEQFEFSERSLRRAVEQAQLNLRWRETRLPEFIHNLHMRFYD